MITVDIRESEKLPQVQSGFVSFQYNDEILNCIKSLPFREYNVETQCWEILETEIIPLYLQLKDKYEFEFYGELSPEIKTDFIDDYEFKTKPFKHQYEGIKYGILNDLWLLGDEQGLGKTLQVIDIATIRKELFGYKHCLIVCGVNTLKWNWVKEIHTHSNEDAHILGQRLTRKGKVKIGSTADKLADVKALFDKDENLPYFIVTNIESFRNKDIAENIKKLCGKHIINMCAFDECHKAKDPQSQQSRGFLKCNPDCRIAMTGTPIMNTPLDTYFILKWLGYETHAFGKFRAHYAIMGGFGNYDVVGYKNLPELQNKIDYIMLRRLKEDVFDLPEKVYIDECLEMTSKQEQIYKEAEQYVRDNIDKIKLSPSPLGALIRLRQATGYPGILSSTITESVKLDRMEEIVDESMLNKRQVVIFSNWTQMTDAIYDRLHQKYTLSLITGDTKDEVRQTNVEQFQNGNSKIIIGTIGAMGTGLTLTAGTVVIFMDHPWNRALYDQAVDRCHRIGQKSSITIYNLMCKDTIDERIWSIVKTKGAISDAVIDGKNTIDLLLGGI